jgi:hypothetical protein
MSDALFSFSFTSVDTGCRPGARLATGKSVVSPHWGHGMPVRVEGSSIAAQANKKDAHIDHPLVSAVRLSIPANSLDLSHEPLLFVHIGDFVSRLNKSGKLLCELLIFGEQFGAFLAEPDK